MPLTKRQVPSPVVAHEACHAHLVLKAYLVERLQKIACKERLNLDRTNFRENYSRRPALNLCVFHYLRKFPISVCID